MVSLYRYKNMIDSKLIRNDIKPLTPEISVHEALETMEEYKVSHLPVFEHEQYIGLISENDLLDAYDHSLNIKEGSSKLIRSFIPADRHIIDAIKVFGDLKLSLLPVLDEEESYEGYLLPSDIVKSMGQMLSFNTPGGILILTINNNDFFMSQIAQIVESNDAKILASYLTAAEGSTQIELTLKINKTDLSSVIQSFNRYNYSVSATYHQSSDDLDLQFRYDNFLKYLNI